MLRFRKRWRRDLPDIRGVWNDDELPNRYEGTVQYIQRLIREGEPHGLILRKFAELFRALRDYLGDDRVADVYRTRFTRELLRAAAALEDLARTIPPEWIDGVRVGGSRADGGPARLREMASPEAERPVFEAVFEVLEGALPVPKSDAYRGDSELSDILQELLSAVRAIEPLIYERNRGEPAFRSRRAPRPAKKPWIRALEIVCGVFLLLTILALFIASIVD